jgi:hypothetical protein
VQIHCTYFSTWKGYRYFPEDATYADLFREIISINYRDVIKIVGVVFVKIAILSLGARLNSAYFWTYIVHIDQATTYDG